MQHPLDFCFWFDNIIYETISQGGKMYGTFLRGLESGAEIMIDRDSNPQAVGKLIRSTEEGCLIDRSNQRGEYAIETFIAFRDMRGVTVTKKINR